MDSECIKLIFKSALSGRESLSFLEQQEKYPNIFNARERDKTIFIRVKYVYQLVDIKQNYHLPFFDKVKPISHLASSRKHLGL